MFLIQIATIHKTVGYKYCGDMWEVLKKSKNTYYYFLQKQHGYEEFKSIEKARDAMTDVAEFTNEVKRDSETLMIIRQIEVPSII